MNDLFPQIPLIELCEPTRGIRYGILKVGTFIPDGIPVIRGGDIRGGVVTYDEKKKVSREISEKFSRTILQGGEIVINLIAEAGHSAIVPEEFQGFNVSRDVAVIPIIETVSKKYIDYYLRSPSAVWWFHQRLQGSVTQKINLETLREVPVSLPPLGEQKAIANILGTLDDKIELNRKTNKTLEGIAKALFKSWFVDFDPVRAKAEGRPTGLPDEISEMFPDSFEESELGEIPQDWRRQVFGDFTTAKRGKIITKKNTEAGKVPVVAGGMTPAYFHNQFNVSGPVVTISASGANAGFVNLYFEPIWASDCSYLSRTETNFPFTCYLFLTASQERIYDAQHGGVQPHINPGDLARLDFVTADDCIFTAFEEIISPNFLKMENANKEITLLESLRDALLPRLISGELRVPDAEKMLEEVGI